MELFFIAFLACLFVAAFFIGSRPDSHKDGCNCYDCTGWNELARHK